MEGKVIYICILFWRKNNSLESNLPKYLFAIKSKEENWNHLKRCKRETKSYTIELNSGQAFNDTTQGRVEWNSANLTGSIRRNDIVYEGAIVKVDPHNSHQTTVNLFPVAIWLSSSILRDWLLCPTGTVRPPVSGFCISQSDIQGKEAVG